MVSETLPWCLYCCADSIIVRVKWGWAQRCKMVRMFILDESHQGTEHASLGPGAASPSCGVKEHWSCRGNRVGLSKAGIKHCFWRKADRTRASASLHRGLWRWRKTRDATHRGDSFCLPNLLRLSSLRLKTLLSQQTRSWFQTTLLWIIKTTDYLHKIERNAKMEKRDDEYIHGLLPQCFSICESWLLWGIKGPFQRSHIKPSENTDS